MKVAVCVGGIVYPDTIHLMDKLKRKFPEYDFFFGIWEGREDDTSKSLNAWSFKEHEPTYHPYLDMDPVGLPPKIKLIQEKMRRHTDAQMPMRIKAFHQTKQILMHSYMLDKLPQEYDMIMRTRYDIDLINNSIDFNGLIERSYNNNQAIGFAKRYRQHPDMFDPKGTKDHNWWDGFLMDLIIFHPRNLFDKEIMVSLHQKQKLLAAEFGWYQVLSQPHGDTHQNYFCDISMTSRDK